MQVEEIVLSSERPDTPVEQPAVDLVCTATLTQASRLRLCTCAFELFNRRYLSVSMVNTLGADREYDLDIGILDATPKRSLKISWRYLALFAAFTASSVYSMFNYAPNAQTWSAVSGVLAGLTLVLAVYGSHDRLVFYSRNGRLPLIILFNRNPDRKTFRAFTNLLIQHIEETKQTLLDRNLLLNTELMEHRRLMEEGIISVKRYDQAKSRILRKHR